MPSNWENIQKTVKGELSNAAAATKKYFKIGKVKLDAMSINNSLNDRFRELGIEVYNQITEEIKGDIRHNPKVKSLIEKVNELKKSIKDGELEIEEIKK
jgi:anti-sigma28 factor (negative regulator of flagellin synthesis)